jgi:polysaccharide biosynthesis/export protein ExoF
LSARWPIRRCSEAEGPRVQADIANDLAAVERQIADNERELNASEDVLSSLPATRATFAPSKEAANPVPHQIVRQTATGPVSIPSSGMTLLQPGDLVNIMVGTGEATGQPTAPDATPAEALPIGHAARRPPTIRRSGRTIAQD